MTAFVLFLTGLVQVFLVATNTRQISQGRLIGSYVVGFAISAVWAYNVHHIAVTGLWGGFWYAQGAACGTVLAILATQWWYRQ